MNVSEKKILQFESTIYALEELLNVSESSFLEESKKLEELNELLKKENTYRRFFEASPEAMLTLSDNKFIDCNESTVKMLLAKNKDEVLNTSPWDLSPEYQPDGRLSSEKAEEMISKALKQGAHFFEWYHKRMNGEVFPVEVTLTMITIEGKNMFNVAWRDITEKKQAEKKLNEYHQHLEELVKAKTEQISVELEKHKRLENDIEQILDASSDAIRVIDKNYNIIYTSKSFNLLHGHPENIVGKKCYEVVPEDECHTKNCSLKRILKSRKKFSIEKTLKTLDGNEKIYDIDVIPYNDSNGNFFGIIKNYRDITEAKKAEARLAEEIREREMLAEKYRILFETSGDAIALFDEKGFFDCNKTTLKFFGYLSKEELIGKTPIDITTAEQSDGQKTLMAYKEHIEKAFKEGTDCFEWMCVRKNGTTFPTEVMLSRMEYQGKVVMLAVVRDITERKKAEARLVEEISEREKLAEKYRILFESSGDAIMMFDEQGFYDCNKATLNLFGFSTKKEFIKMHPGDISPAKQPDGRDSFATADEHIEKAFRKRTEFFEWVHKRQDGTQFPAEVLLSRMEFKGKIVVQATVRDISSRKYAEQQRAKAQKIAEENAQQQGRIEMANNVLHDIGNAMTGVSTYVINPQINEVWQEIKSLNQLLGLFTDSEDKLIKVFGKEKQQAMNDFIKALITAFEERRAKHLKASEKISAAVGHVCSVLDLQRHYLKENASPLATKINLSTIIGDTLFMLSGSIKKRNIKVILDVKDKNLNISGDQTRLIRVFLNIIKNICEAFDETVSVKNGRKLEITIALDKDQKMVKIIFSDNGIGFAIGTGEELFKRGVTSKINGSGIGLHECRSIIESHGGRITMTSNGINTGASTIITFPVLK